MQYLACLHIVTQDYKIAKSDNAIQSLRRRRHRKINTYALLLLVASLPNWAQLLTLKGPITTAADDIYEYFFIVFQRK